MKWLAYLGSLAVALAAAFLSTTVHAHGLATCDSGPESGWQSKAQLEKKLADRKWKVRRILVSWGCYEVYGSDEYGRYVELPFHPVTLALVPKFSTPATSAAAQLPQASAAGAGSPVALADDTLKIAADRRGSWDTALVELGQRAGIFKKNGLKLEIVWTKESSETQQAVISGTADVGVAPGIMGALSAYSKGDPVRIIGAEKTGAGDVYWYVPAKSPIKSLKDIDGKTIAYPTNGSPTHGLVTALIQQFGLKAKPTATGDPAPTLDQVMANQIDVGWSTPPFGLQQLDEGKIRIIATGNEAAAFKERTVRVLITNKKTLETRKAAIVHFMKAYRDTLDWLYSDDPEALRAYADFAGISLATAKRTRDDFFPKLSVDPDYIYGLHAILPEAAALKYTPTQLPIDKLLEVIQVPPRVF